MSPTAHNILQDTAFTGLSASGAMIKTIDRTKVHNIMIRATNWVGDAVMTIPAVEAVRSNFPDSHISVIARPWVIPLFRDHPCVDEVVPFEKGENTLTSVIETARIISFILNRRFDLAILLQNAFEAAFIAAMGKVRYRVGYDTDARGFLLTHKVKRTREVLKIHQVEYYLYLLHKAGLKAESGPPVIHIPENKRREAINFLNSNLITTEDFTVGLSPGAIFGEAKRWPPERFAEIGDRAVEKWNARIIVFGSKKETEVCQRTCDCMQNNALNLCGATSLDQAMALISLCNLFVSNDSGLMHVAAALQIPTVAVFGSTDPVATGPYSPVATVVKHNISCAPCLRRKCPSDYRCMLSVTVEEVWHEMSRIKRRLQ